ncbi:MAG: 50S ribosomal protein L29 [Vampirovibrionales bacterium]|nr:50S ribosomal protein L29 [Vampirovibrionales bacterium]
MSTATTLAELRAMNEDDLQNQLDTLVKEVFQLRFKKSLNQLENPSLIRKIKHLVSQISTVLHEKKHSAAQAELVS